MKVSKTKLAGLGFILFGIGGIFSGKVDIESGIQSVLTGLAVIGGRSALDKINR